MGTKSNAGFFIFIDLGARSQTSLRARCSIGTGVLEYFQESAIMYKGILCKWASSAMVRLPILLIIPFLVRASAPRNILFAFFVFCLFSKAIARAESMNIVTLMLCFFSSLAVFLPWNNGLVSVL